MKRTQRPRPLPGGRLWWRFLPLLWLGLQSAAGAQTETKEPSSCQLSLWGCPSRRQNSDRNASSSPAEQYDRLLGIARNRFSVPRGGVFEDLETAVRALTEATELLPDVPDAYSLLGLVKLERGQLEPARAALRRAEELHRRSVIPLMGTQEPRPLEYLDPQLSLGLGLIAALEGDFDGALARYLRLLRLGVSSHRLFYRTGDVLMALGRLEEATVLFERACALPRTAEIPYLDVARACYGLLVALDRGERVRAAYALRRVRALDRDLRALRYPDFLSPWEKKYHQALALPPSCERMRALREYLRGATNATRNPPPLSYVQRAESHLHALAALTCSEN